MNGAGDRDVLVTIQSATTARNAYNEEVETWSGTDKEWSQVFYGRGDERRSAAMEEGRQVATFQMLSNDTTRAVTLKHRFLLDGEPWDIEQISPNTPDRHHIEFEAARSL